MTDTLMFERQYDIEGTSEKIFLQIFEPQPVERGGWHGTFVLHAPYLECFRRKSWAPGDDRLDALAWVFIKITIDLRSLARRSGYCVTFNGSKNLDLIDRDFY